MKLPSMVYASQKSEVEQVVFGGLNHSESAGAGEIYDMCNISSDLYPILSPRQPRRKVVDQQGVESVCSSGDNLWYVQEKKLYRAGVAVDIFTHESGMKEIVISDPEKMTDEEVGRIITRFGKYLILSGNSGGLVYNTESGECRKMNAEYSGTGRVTSGKLYGQDAVDNCLTFVDYDWSEFSVGDGVHITRNAEDGSVLFETDAVIREIYGKSAHFDENVFAGLASNTSRPFTVKREAPIIGTLCACDNRLFGYLGDKIYASALGDPFNWNVFDGLSTDSWSVEVSGGDFTGCIEYLGHPYFFKEDAIYKLYGGYPSEYSLEKTTAFGVRMYDGETLAVVGNTLYYLSTAGVCAYDGDYPTVILPFDQMGGNPAGRGYAAGDGRKYYLLISRFGVIFPDTDGDGISDIIGDITLHRYAMYVYDAMRGLWHKEDADVIPVCRSGFPGMWVQNFYGYNEEGIWLMGTPAFPKFVDAMGTVEFGTAEESVESFVEFGEGYHDTLNAKKLWRLHVRLWVAKGAKVTFSISYDGGKYKVIREFGQTDKRSFVIPIAAKRCDSYRLRIDGVGEYKIYSLAREYSVSAGAEKER